MTTLQDVLDEAATVSAKLDTAATDQAAAFAKLQAEIGTPEDLQPAVDAVNALGAKADALDAAATAI